MELKPNFEIVGVLSDVKEDDGQLKLTFAICKDIEIPEHTIPIEKLRNAVGNRIGIFNHNNRYSLRMAKKK